MDNRYRGRSYSQDNRDPLSRRNRQDEQFSSGSDEQYGEGGWRSQGGDRWQSGGGEFERGSGSAQSYQRDEFVRPSGGYRSDTSSLDDYDRQGTTRWGRDETTHSSFRPDDFGGQDYTRGSYAQSRNMTGYGSRNFGGASYGASMYDRGGTHIPPRQYDRDDRGFFDRASDEVMSWFGDDDAARRRQLDHREDHRGRGPANYTRSNERLLEDACERLTRDPNIDASKIDVTCENNEVTLNGTVDSRSAKRRAEDIVDDISGVKHVQNNLRVESRDSYYSETSTLSDS